MKQITLLSVLGWEERFIESFNIITTDFDVEEIIMLVFDDYMSMPNMLKNAELIKGYGTIKNIKVDFIHLNYNDSVNNWNILSNFFNSNKYVNIFVNITTIPRETIWTLLFFVRRSIKKLDYIYFKPIDYCNEWLTKNYREPNLLFKHSGLFNLGKDLTLFIISGFDDSRFEQLIEYYEPDKIIIFSQTGDQFDNNVRSKDHDKYLSRYKECIKIVNFDSYNYEQAVNILYEQYEIYGDDNIILDSQGPKLSALSAYRVHIMSNFKIALAYVSAKDYNSNYSKGIDKNYIIGEFALN